MMIRFKREREFQKDFKRLVKKHRSLPDDLQEFCSVVLAVPLGTSKHFTIVKQVGKVRVIKGRLFCKYLKGSSLRIVYAYLEQNRQIDFIELYSKGEQENEDQDRIDRYLRDRKPEDSP